MENPRPVRVSVYNPYDRETDGEEEEEELPDLHVDDAQEQVDPRQLDRGTARKLVVAPHNDGLKTGVRGDDGRHAEHPDNEVNWLV